MVAGRCICILFTLVVLAPTAGAQETPPIIDIPKLDNITIDGNGDEWGDRGYRVDVMRDADGAIVASPDFDTSFRVGWDARGVLVLMKVLDDKPVEAAGMQLWTGDSFELFLAPKRRSEDLVQVMIGPGMDPKFPDLHQHVVDLRTEKLKQAPINITAARQKIEGGYVIEVLLPWDMLGITPEVGAEAAMQLYVSDVDSAGGKPRTALWYPGQNTGRRRDNINRICLAEKPSAPVLAGAQGRYERFCRFHIEAVMDKSFGGKRLSISDGKNTLGSTLLEAQGTRARAAADLPMPNIGETLPPIQLLIEGTPVATVNPSDANLERAQAMAGIRVAFKPCVFFGNAFPECEVIDPNYVEDVIGRYTIKTTFYDRDYNVVTEPKANGRYGAAVEIVPSRGPTLRRFVTLYRTPGWDRWSERTTEATIPFPPEFGIDPKVLDEQKRDVGFVLRERFREGSWADDGNARLLAGLSEVKPGTGPLDFTSNAVAMDRAWWLGLKRKFSGLDKKYAKPFIGPIAIDGPPAPVLREGMAAEAGVTADAAEKIDAVLQKWAASTDEPFAVCVARRGVIVLHKAYGRRDGVPMTVKTPSNVASLTKIVFGAAFGMLIDQNLIDPDAPIDQYLPGLRSKSEPKKPMTFRHCLTHTAGLPVDIRDDQPDADDRVAPLYAVARVGQKHQYQGAGYVLAGRAVENVTGEILPVFYKKHLLDPLGCTDTEMTSAASDTRSVPLDLARVGQLFLNHGAYGDKRFFSEATYQMMLPRKLTDVLGPDTSAVWGLGLQSGPGGSITHGSATWCTFLVYPKTEMVIVMTRNGEGERFNEFHPQFLKACAAAVVDAPATQPVSAPASTAK